MTFTSEDWKKYLHMCVYHRVDESPDDKFPAEYSSGYGARSCGRLDSVGVYLDVSGCLL